MESTIGNGRQVCVTGASGFIGAHVVKLLLQRGYRVRGTVRDAGDGAKTDFLQQLAGGAPHPLELFSADLSGEGSFDEAIWGCELVCHVASPIQQLAKDPQREIVDPAVNGTLNVLRSVQRAGTVKRLALTSSMGAVLDLARPADHRFTDQDWNESATLKTSPYPLSKTLAERAAWDFVDALPEEQRFAMVALHPAWVQGPILTAAHANGSPSVIRDLLVRTFPACPRLHFGMVDVRDVALAHALALENPQASGRYILIHEAMWMQQMARFIAGHFPDHPVPTRRLPDLLMYANALFDKRITLRWARDYLGRTFDLDNSRSLEHLGLRYRPLEQTLLDACTSMVELGVAPPRKRG
jgi:nucleoside-diphosphate-sugar epimerase